MIKPADRQAFLIVTRKISNHVLKLYHQLKKTTADLGDVILLYHIMERSPAVSIDGVKIETFTDNILQSMDYQAIRRTLVPGSNHFPVLNFFLRHPEYKYFWCIEDDVVYTGSWKNFFSVVSTELKYDFISSHIRSYPDLPQWFWWNSFKNCSEEVDKNGLFNSFNPIYRISQAALKHIDQCLKNGYRGHHEVLIPTLLKKKGFLIADLSNKENNITPILSLCSLRTMRWKPIFIAPGKQKNMLYHPVKAKIKLYQLYIYIKRILQNKMEYLSDLKD